MGDWGLRIIGALLALAVAVPITAIVIGRALAPEPELPYLAGVQGSGRPLRWLANDRVLFEKPGGRGVSVLTVDGEVPLDLDLVTEFDWAESPDGTEAAYIVRERQGSALYVGPIDGTRPPRLLARSDEPEMWMDHVQWTGDGHYVVFDSSSGTRVVPSEGGVPQPYVSVSLARASETVAIPPGGPFPDYVTRAPTYTFLPAYSKLEPGRKLGRWTVAPGGDQLVVDASGERCILLLPSPDGRFFACTYSKIDRASGASESGGAIVVAS
jgi:hypothetical protein